MTLPLFGNVALPGADKRIHNVFAGIPDVPLGRFDLTFTSASPLQLQRGDLLRRAPDGDRDADRPQRRGDEAEHADEGGGCPPIVALVLRGHKLA